MRERGNQWWRQYLLFKCCVLVMPIYTLLLLIGLYCILYNIDVQAPLKSIYELVILLLSAAAIFILVLLLATLNGHGQHSHHECMDDPNMIMQHASSLSSSRQRPRHCQTQDGTNVAQSTTMASSIISTLFGTFHTDDPDDPDECYDSDMDLDLTIAQLNAAESGLMGTIEQTTTSLEYLLDMEQNGPCDLDETDRFEPIIPNPLLQSIKAPEMASANGCLNSSFYPTLIAPGASFGQCHQMAPSPLSQSYKDSRVANYDWMVDVDLPPSYEEAMKRQCKHDDDEYHQH